MQAILARECRPRCGERHVRDLRRKVREQRCRVRFREQGDVCVFRRRAEKRHRERQVSEPPKFEDEQSGARTGVWRRFCQARGVKFSIARMTSSPEPGVTVRANAPTRGFGWTAVLCAMAGAALFQFFGNANRGYIDTRSLFYWWGYQWTNPASDLQHAWFVVAVSGWLFWRNLRQDDGRREAESRARSETFLPVLGAMVGGLVLHAVGFIAQQARLSIVAVLIFAWGVVRLAGGRRWAAAAVFPLGFIVFTIPVNVLDSVGFWLRMWVIDASAAVAHACGIGVVQSGTQLVAPDGRYHYDVVAACSGVRSLSVLAALSLLLGYLSLRSMWRRAVVLALCFPLVLAGNIARLVIIVLAAQLGGAAWGNRAHDVMGLGVFAIVLGGVFAAIWAMERFAPERAAEMARRTTSPASDTSEAQDPREPRTGHASSRSIVARPTIVAIVVLMVAAIEMVGLHHLAQLPARGGAGVVLAASGVDPVELPAFLGTEWVGRRSEITAVEREILPPDTGYSRKQYVPVADPTKAVLLSLVLSGRDRTSIHRPELCLVGQGWTITGETTHRFYDRRPIANSPGSRPTFPATVLRVRREVPAVSNVTGPRVLVVPQLVAYWFIAEDAVVATHWERLVRDSWNRVAHGRADRWAYVLMQTDASDGEAAALARMQTVLDGTLPVFQRALP